GKSWLMLDVALSIAAGVDFCGFENTLRRRGRVLVLAMEDNERRLRQRVWQLMRGRGLERDDLSEYLIINSRDFFYFDDPENVGRLKDLFEEWRPDVVFVDSLARAFRGDENDKRAVSELTRPWQE